MATLGLREDRRGRLIDCEQHGHTSAGTCCSHVADALAAGSNEPVFFLFDDYGQSREVCQVCRAIGLKYARELPAGEKLGDYPLRWRFVCWEHLEAWYLETTGAALLSLLQAERERTRSRPERAKI